MTAVRPVRRIPEATVARLPVYLRSLYELAEARTSTISSERLAEMAGVNAAKVRKDLSYLGSYGTRGVGYDVQYLLFQMSRELGLTQDWPVVIVGIGNLGHALANYGGFGERGFPVAALVDADPARVGERIGDIAVRHVDDLPDIVHELGVAIGVVATPAAVAQEVVDAMVAAGIRSILNFAPASVTVPDTVSLRKVDLAVELQILSFYQQRSQADAG
jgi:redox-sensing transcriptional repressor